MVSKCREEFHRAQGLRDATAVSDALTVGYTQLDNLDAQVAHMRAMMQQGALVHKGGMVEWRKDEEATRRLEERQRKEKEERKRLLQQVRRLQKLQTAQPQSKAQSQPSAELLAHRSAGGASG